MHEVLGPDVLIAELSNLSRTPETTPHRSMGWPE